LLHIYLHEIKWINEIKFLKALKAGERTQVFETVRRYVKPFNGIIRGTHTNLLISRMKLHRSKRRSKQTYTWINDYVILILQLIGASKLFNSIETTVIIPSKDHFIPKYRGRGDIGAGLIAPNGMTVLHIQT